MFCRTASACLLLAVAGCSDKDITSYRVPKDPGAATAPAPSETGAAGAPIALHWETPAGWQVQAASGLRVASFLAPGQGGASADVSVVTFAGAGGDVLANINRWRRQLQLPPIAAETLPAEVNILEATGGHFLVADIQSEPMQGKPKMGILGAWLEEPGQVWFFKMMGPEDVVQAQKVAFIGFLKSVAPGSAIGGAPSAAPNDGQASENTNDLPHAGFIVAPNNASDGPSLRWQAPPDWEAGPATAMRKASYVVSRAGLTADLSITAFPGDVGGLAANVNRWRSQIDLPPVDDASLGTITDAFDSNGLQFVLVDFAGDTPAGRQRILAGLASWQGATWFFKMMGPDSLVEGEKTAFIAFLRTVEPK